MESQKTKAFCRETATGSKIFTREYKKATVTLDCAKFEGTSNMMASDAHE